MLFPAMAFERHGRFDRALEYVAQSLESDLTKGGSPISWTRALSLSCRGRILKARGQATEALAAFEEAMAELQPQGYWLLEAIVLYEKAAVGPAGRRAETRRQLAEVTGRLVSPEAEVAKLFGARFGGWQAVEAAPKDVHTGHNPGHNSSRGEVELPPTEAANPGSTAAERAVRGRLGSSMKELRQRAAVAGFADVLIEDARDSDAPKEELARLIVAHELPEAALEDSLALEATTTAESLKLLRDELSALSLRELRTRAASAGVDADDVEDARDADDPKAALVQLVVEAEAVAM